MLGFGKIAYLFLFIPFLALSPINSLAEEGKTLKVAVLLGLTGSAAFQSEAVKNGVLLAASELEREGWKLDLKFEDDQTNPAKTVSATRALLAQGYSRFVGPTWSFQINAVRSILEHSDAVAITPTSSSDINGGSSDNVFNLCFPRLSQTGVIKNWLEERKLKKALIFTPNGEWGELHSKVFQESVRSVGGEIVGMQSFDYGIDAVSVRSLLLRYKNSGAEVLFVTGAPADTANFLRARNTLKLPLQILATAELMDAVSLKILPAKQLDSKVSVVSLNSSAQFKEAYRNHYKQDPKLYADRGYEALMLFSKAVSESDGQPSSVRRYLKNVEVKEGATTRKLFDDHNDSTLGGYEIYTPSDKLSQN